MTRTDEPVSYPSDDRHPRVRRWAKLGVLVAAIVALVVGVARLTGGDDDSTGDHRPRSHGSTSDSGGQTQDPTTQQQEAEFAECMRARRIDFPPGPDVDVNGPEFQNALAACEAQLSSAGGDD